MNALPFRPSSKPRQSGVAAVELALIMVFAFLPLLLGILELSRLFYVTTTVEEVTRRAAREQVVRWTSQSAAVQRYAVFQPVSSTGTVALPGGREVTNSAVLLTFHHSYADALDLTSTGITGIASPQVNLNTCLLDPANANCILFVRATLQGVSYSPMVDWFGGLFSLPLSAATVIMPAEALGLL